VPTPVLTGPAGRPRHPAPASAPGPDPEEAATTRRIEGSHLEAPLSRWRLSRMWHRLPWRRERATAAGGRRPARHTTLGRIALGLLLSAALLVVVAPPAFAAGGQPTLNGVISNLTNWIVGILAGVATLFLTIGGLRYLAAGGDPSQVEKAKVALKSAAIGYALAILAPLLVSILASVVGG
jgi:Type IV secretion system pilin